MLLVIVPIVVHAHQGAGWQHGLADGARLTVGSVQFLFSVLAAALLTCREARPNYLYGAIALVTGMVLGVFGSYLISTEMPVVLMVRCWLIFLGLLILSDIRLPGRIVNVLRFLSGGLAGLEFGVIPFIDPLQDPSPTTGFVVVSIAIFFAFIFPANHYRSGWQRISIRVAGSWIAAIAMITAAFLLKNI